MTETTTTTATYTDFVLVPRDLIGSACAAIDKKRDAPKTLSELRRYAMGQSVAAAASAKCKARSQADGGAASSNCEWPLCDCDPHAVKVIAALEEMGNPAAPSPAPAAPSAAQWMPIETAPKDETGVLLYCVPNEAPSLKPHIAPGYWQKSNGLMAPGLWLLSQAVGPSYKPTHWMPLPADPSAQPAQPDVGPNVAVQDVAEQVERRVNERGGEAAVDDIVALTIEVLWEMQRAQPAQDSLTEAAAAVLHEYDHPATGDGDLFGKMQTLRLALSAARAAQPVGEVAPILWCVHHIGPDDLHPVESYEAAVKMADAINDQSEKFNFGHKPDSINYVYSRAYPAIWTGTPESHAEWIEKGRAALRTAGEAANG